MIIKLSQFKTIIFSTLDCTEENERTTHALPKRNPSEKYPCIKERIGDYVDETLFARRFRTSSQEDAAEWKA